MVSLASLMFAWALASCGGVGSRITNAEFDTDGSPMDASRIVDSGTELVDSRDSVVSPDAPDVQPGDQQCETGADDRVTGPLDARPDTADVAPGSDLADLDSVEATWIETLDQDFRDSLADVDDGGPVADSLKDAQLEDKGGDPNEPYPCPTGQDGNKELMPLCPYGAFMWDYMQYIEPPRQFEIYSPETPLGLPPGFVLGDGQKVALLRYNWTDPWTDMFVASAGCPPEWDGCKACGGHCFPPQGYVHVIDLQTLSIVYSAKDVVAPGSNVAKCLNQAECYELESPDDGIRIKLTTCGMWYTGTSNILTNILRVYPINGSELVTDIPIPLF